MLTPTCGHLDRAVYKHTLCAACYAISFLVEQDGVERVLYTPSPKQQLFHAATEPNVIMEGSRGGGKSLALRMDAHMRCMAMPGFKALILRRVMPELRRSHLVYIKSEADLLGAEYKQAVTTVHYANGSILVFGHCEDDAAVEKYLSSEWDGIYFDELVTFELRQFLLIAASARSTVESGRVAIIRGGTNPVGIGATWVKQYFLTKNPKREEAPDYIPDDYRAIKVNLTDNAHIDRDDYMKRLRSLPTEALRRAYAFGEWTVEGTFFPEWRESDPETGQEWHVIADLPTYKGRPLLSQPWLHITCVLDWGYARDGNPGYAVWFANMLDGSAIAFDEYIFSETSPSLVAAEMKARSVGYAHVEYIGDPAMWEERSGESIAETLARNGVSMSEADHTRKAGWIRVHTMLKEEMVVYPHSYPRLRFLRGGVGLNGASIGVPQLITNMPQMLADPKDPNDMRTAGVADDGPDDVRYFAMSRPYASPAPETIINPDVQEILDFIARKKLGQHRLGRESQRPTTRHAA